MANSDFVQRCLELDESNSELLLLLPYLVSIVKGFGSNFCDHAIPLIRKGTNIIRCHQRVFKLEEVWLLDLLILCCHDEVAEVQVGAFLSLRHLAKVYPGYVLTRLPQFVNAVCMQLDSYTSNKGSSFRAAINACWALGEVSMMVPSGHQQELVYAIPYVLKILQDHQRQHEDLIKNCAHIVGRLACVCASHVSVLMEYFIESLCMTLSKLRDDDLKKEIFRGLCAIVGANPYGALGGVLYVCNAAASLNDANDIVDLFSNLIYNYREIHKGGAWDQLVLHLTPEVKMILASRFGPKLFSPTPPSVCEALTVDFYG